MYRMESKDLKKKQAKVVFMAVLVMLEMIKQYRKLSKRLFKNMEKLTY
jgi:hypothetical protein